MVGKMVKSLNSKGKFAKIVETAGVPFHSPAMVPAAEIFLKALEGVCYQIKPTFEVFKSVYNLVKGSYMRALRSQIVTI